jgi:hypothetical protein
MRKLVKRESIAVNYPKCSVPQQIVERFYLKAVSIVKASPVDTKGGEYFYTLASYCDEIYSEMYGNDIHTRSQSQLKSREVELQELKGLAAKAQKSNTNYMIARLLKQINVEKQEIEKINQDASYYLLISIENYLASLTIWDQKLELMVLRLCALWYIRLSKVFECKPCRH